MISLKTVFYDSFILFIKNNSFIFASPRKMNGIEEIEGVMRCPDGGIGRRAGLKHQW